MDPFILFVENEFGDALKYLVLDNLGSGDKLGLSRHECRKCQPLSFVGSRS